MEKIIELPDEEWDENSKALLFAWLELIMELPQNQLAVYGMIVPPSGIEPELKN